MNACQDLEALHVEEVILKKLRIHVKIVTIYEWKKQSLKYSLVEIFVKIVTI